jgi:signal transduction histidine kinase
LPSGVDLAAYRIIQESLTNVVRHARATSAQIAIAYRPAEVEIEIIDDGVQLVPPERAGSGSGLIGMRERATALGGELDASPRPGGGFRVRARLPTGGIA